MRRITMKDRSINQKLFLTYVLLIIVPLIFISLISYYYSISFLEGRIVNSFTELNRQMITNTDAFLQNMLRTSGAPFYDQELLAILAKDYDSYEYPVYEKAKDYKFVNDSFFRNILLFNDDIDSLVIYPNNNDVAYRKGYQVIYNYEYKPDEEEWFRYIVSKEGAPVVVGLHPEKQVSSSERYVLTVGRVIVDPTTNRKLGVFLIHIRENALQKLYQGLKSGPEAEQIIVDENGAILFSTHTGEVDEQFQAALSRYPSGTFNPASLEGSEKYYIVHNASQVSGWQFYTVIHKDKLFHEVYSIRNFIAMIVVILIVVAFIVAYLVSRSISNPIMKLSRMMKKVEQGNFNVTVDVKSGDEVGRLSRSFNAMTSEIKSLIGRIKEEEGRKRSAELNALQTQINPHFIYNTLSVVKWMAQAQMADNITETLDSFIRLLTFSTQNTQQFVSIEEEISFIKNYVSLLQLRYFNTFEAEYDIAEEVLNYRTLKFIVQPFVENAVFHGFAAGNPVKYRLIVSVRQKGGAVEFTIRDNGAGMSEAQIRRLSKESGKGKKGMNSIGVRNVTERIGLHFGPAFGVNIDSSPGEGTVVAIRIPVLAHADSPREKEG
ncbi:sensor histidine kinase [Paenibacillus sp. MSJ-34]|uniref:sensor histidine kinase n=2 Tax=unclassified Paenibacillus TaxID=185978 RepID=UPI001C1239D6|nr:sensor histidine kinase [Paenibacillus sp. MSJ-34]MBU5444762.1 sensor histidine kinase [Paenibacillus sp. MSJ-34]CAH0119337.1 hypothetical protein PAE9249_01836 [Paenibacillus sp. CECT 9249]